MFVQVKRLTAPEHIVSPRQFIASRLGAWQTPDGSVRPGWWTTRTLALRGSAGRLTVAGGSSARERVRARHGQAGLRLLGDGERTLTAERITAHGRAARAANPSRHPTAHESVPINQKTATQERVAREQLRADLIGKARAWAANNANTGSGCPAGTSIEKTSTAPQDRPLSAYERAVARAEAEGLIRRRRGRRS
jgi:hypothetical protein